MRFLIQKARFTVPLVVLTGVLLATPAIVSAQSTAGGASLQIPPGARAEGMGRFFTAVADDAFSPWWNPAGLAFMKGWNAGLMHARLVPDLADDVYYEYLGVSNYVKGWGGIAGTFTYLNYGESIATNPDSPDAIGTFSSFEFSPSVAIGTEVIPNLGLGLNLKLIHVNFAPSEFADGGGSGTSFGVDLGVLYAYKKNMDGFLGSGPAEMEFNVGVVVANLGPNISLVDNQESDPLPRNLKTGLAWGVRVPKSYSILLGGAMEKSLVFEPISDEFKDELSFAEQNDIVFSGGLEFGILDMVFARIGYIYDDPGEIKDPTYGFGFHLKTFGFDFASIPQFEELDRVSKFSVVARFD